LPDNNAVHLSPREREVATLVAQGFQNKAIAQRLGLQARTIGSYLDRIFGKTRIMPRTRTALTAWCYQSGLVSVPAFARKRSSVSIRP
jgi:DNA-binding NarL/FixJ family response regulator